MAYDNNGQQPQPGGYPPQQEPGGYPPQQQSGVHPQQPGAYPPQGGYQQAGYGGYPNMPIPPRKMPGRVVTAAVLMWISFGFTAIGLLFLFAAAGILSAVDAPVPDEVPIFLAITAVVWVIQLVGLIALHMRKNWGRIALIAICAVSILSLVWQFVESDSVGTGTVSVAINVLVIVFLANKDAKDYCSE
ncbi:hypothetical protein [Salininema proteolyticum]|uniref:Integral membrane protein n=1 Tax=Salininema proteolyticum TaxID=1607685 RepID=A0ABV8TUZ3_9ACTN